MVSYSILYLYHIFVSLYFDFFVLLCFDVILLLEPVGIYVLLIFLRKLCACTGSHIHLTIPMFFDKRIIVIYIAVVVFFNCTFCILHEWCLVWVISFSLLFIFFHVAFVVVLLLLHVFGLLSNLINLSMWHFCVSLDFAIC